MTESAHARRPGPAARRFGYALAIALNVAFLVIINHVLDWGWLPWLTEGFRDVLPIMNASFIASIVANACYLAYDRPIFKGLVELGLLVIALVVTVRLWQVFPFDFSAYDFAWDTLVRWLLAFAIFGIGVAMVGQLAQLVRSASRIGRNASQPSGPAGGPGSGDD